MLSRPGRALLGCILRMRQSNNGVLQGVPSQAPRSDLGSHGGRKAIARCPCTPLASRSHAFSIRDIARRGSARLAHLKGPWKRVVKKINVSSGPSREIAGLKRMKMMKMMTPRSQETRVWEFSHEALKIRRGSLGLWVGIYIWTSRVIW